MYEIVNKYYWVFEALLCLTGSDHYSGLYIYIYFLCGHFGETYVIPHIGTRLLYHVSFWNLNLLCGENLLCFHVASHSALWPSCFQASFKKFINTKVSECFCSLVKPSDATHNRFAVTSVRKMTTLIDKSNVSTFLYVRCITFDSQFCITL